MFRSKGALTFILLGFAASVENVPICNYNTNELTATELICENDHGSDFILTRGIVSDNERTTSISLQRCRLVDLELESFENLNSLKYLDLSQNHIANLKLGVLDGFQKLTYLNVSHNLLSGIELGLFDEKPDLDVLDISGNAIEHLELGVFDPLKKLRHLSLANNKLFGNKLSPYLFDQSTQIRHIDFSRNDMNEAPVKLLHAFRILEFLNLDNCLLKEVPSFATRENLATLEFLFLSSNHIRKLDSPSTFNNLINLKKLFLSDNSIEIVHEDVFKSLNNLKLIDLRGNKIKHLPETLFNNNKHLLNIDLSHNLIETVPVNAFRGTSVKNLNLSNNRFTYLTDNFALELRNSGARLTKFYFNQNPWQCACLMDLWREVKNLEISYNSLQYDGKNPVCVTTKDVFCKRHDSFNTQFTELYDGIASI